MSVYVLERDQVLPIPLEEAWDFFSTPRNLSRITPGGMGFTIHEPFDDRAAHTGQRIRYTVRPLLGIPLTWVTRIEDVVPPRRFVDTQERGPYRKWRHTHTFEPVPGGVRMNDRVEYELPLGPLGDLAHSLFVKRKLRTIFDFRRKALESIFPVQAAIPNPSTATPA